MQIHFHFHYNLKFSLIELPLLSENHWCLHIITHYQLPPVQHQGLAPGGEETGCEGQGKDAREAGDEDQPPVQERGHKLHPTVSVLSGPRQEDTVQGVEFKVGTPKAQGALLGPGQRPGQVTTGCAQCQGAWRGGAQDTLPDRQSGASSPVQGMQRVSPNCQPPSRTYEHEQMPGVGGDPGCQ